MRPRISSVSSTSITGRPDRGGLCSRWPARRPFSMLGCFTVVRPRPQRLGHAVETGHRHLARHVDSAGPQVVHRRDRQHVRGADQRRDARVGVEGDLGRRPARSRLVLIAFHHRQRFRIQSRFDHRVVDAVDPFPLHVEVRRLQPIRTRHHRLAVARRAVPAQPHREQADLPVAKLHNVFGELGHARPVVDADPRGARHVLRLVDDDHGQMPLQHHLQIGVVVGRGVHHEAVDTRREHGGRPVTDASVRPHRDEQQALARVLARLGQAGDEVQRRGIAERVVQRFGHHQTDRACLACPQRAGHRVGPRISEALGRREHPFAQIGRQLVGPVVGVGNRGPGDLQLGRQGKPASPGAAAWGSWTCR